MPDMVKAHGKILMARHGKDNDQTKSGQLRRRGQYRIQHVICDMMPLRQSVFMPFLPKAAGHN